MQKKSKYNARTLNVDDLCIISNQNLIDSLEDGVDYKAIEARNNSIGKITNLQKLKINTRIALGMEVKNDAFFVGEIMVQKKLGA